MGRQNIKISDETWRRLNVRKRPGDTFEDVVERLLDEAPCDDFESTEQTAD